MIRKMLAMAALGSALTAGIPTSVYAADRDDHHVEQRREDRGRRRFDRDDGRRYRYAVPYRNYNYGNAVPFGYYYPSQTHYYPPQTYYYYPNPPVYPNGYYGLLGGFWVR